MIKYELIIRVLLTLVVVTVPLIYVIKRYTSSMKRVLSTLSQLRKQPYDEQAHEIKEEEDEPQIPNQQDMLETKEALPSEGNDEITEITMDIEITIDDEEQEPEIPNEKQRIAENSSDTDQDINSTGEHHESIIVEEIVIEIDEAVVDAPQHEHEPIQTTEQEPSTEHEEPLQHPAKEESLSSIQPEKLQQTLETIKYSALTHKERGKLDMYEKKLIEGLALQPENKDFLRLLSNHYFEQGNYVKALTLLKKLINDDPKNHKAIRQIGQIYREQGDLEAARLLIEKAISLKDDNPTYLISMVEIHYENKEIRDAIKLMERLIKLRPTNIDYLLTLATLHEEISEPTKAMAYYMKTLEFDPLNDHAKTAIRRLNA